MSNLNKTLSLALAVIMLLCVNTAGSQNAYAVEKMNGSVIHPYKQRTNTGDDGITNRDFITPITHKTVVPEGYIGIYTPEDLDAMRNDLGASYILMNNIDLSDWGNWVPIGTGLTGEINPNYDPINPTAEPLYIQNQVPFKGDFDGNGYVISGMTVNEVYDVAEPIHRSAGLFGAIENCTITNVGIVDSEVNVCGGFWVFAAALVGSCFGETNITNCFNTGDVTASGNLNQAVGIVNRQLDQGAYCRVENCYNTGRISGVIEYDTVDIHGTGQFNENITPQFEIAGIGFADEISNCYNSGEVISKVSGSHYMIGLVCASGIGDSPTIKACNNSGNVKSEILDSNISAITLPGLSRSELVIAGGISATFARTITGCTNSGNVSAIITNLSGIEYYLPQAGGIMGHADHSTMLNCSNSGRIMAEGSCDDFSDNDLSEITAFAGGIAGAFDTYNNSGAIYDCFNTGDIKARAAGAEGKTLSAISGGIIGNAEFFSAADTSRFANCFNRGSVTAEGREAAMSGGIFGFVRATILEQSLVMIISNCYNSGEIIVSAENAIYGGIAGVAAGARSVELPLGQYMIFANCYYVTGNNIGIGTMIGDVSSINLTELTDTQMREQSSYVGFDFDYVWSIDSETNNGYPYLRDYVPLTSISFDNAEIKMNKGETQALTITYNPINTTERVVTWSTSDSNIVSVDMDGVITARGVGTATITARVRDKRATCTITVTSNFILGDVNRDGKVNAGDAAMILQWLVKLRTLDDEQIELADFNCDGKSDAGDASAILKWCVGLWP